MGAERDGRKGGDRKDEKKEQKEKEKKVKRKKTREGNDEENIEKKNISEPYCMCNKGTYETCLRVLLHCPLYQDIRESYFTSLGTLRKKFCALSCS